MCFQGKINLIVLVDVGEPLNHHVPRPQDLIAALQMNLQ